MKVPVLSVIFALATSTSASVWNFVPSEWPDTQNWAKQPVTLKYELTEEHTALISTLPKIPATPNVPRVQCPDNLSADIFGEKGSCWWSCQTEKTKCLRETDISSCKKDHYGLIFADGVTKYTPKILDLLQERNVKATFCLIGARLVQDQVLARRIVDEGHDLCMLSWSHWPMTNMDDASIISDIMWSAKAFQDVLGVLPELILPPHGSLDDRVREIIKGLKFKVLMWNFSVQDTRLASHEATGNNRKYADMATIKADFHHKYQKDFPNGILSLHHDSFEASLKYATFVLDTVQPKYKVVPVSQCLDTSIWKKAPGELPVPLKPTQKSVSGAPLSISSGLLAVFGSAGIVSIML